MKYILFVRNNVLHIIFYDLILYRLVDGNLYIYLKNYVDGLLYDIDVCVGYILYNLFD
jgi:hypothetical protein